MLPKFTNNATKRSKDMFKLGLYSHVYFTNLNAISNYTSFIRMQVEGDQKLDRGLQKFFCALETSNQNLLLFLKLQMTLNKIEGGDYQATVSAGFIYEQVQQVVNSIEYDITERNYGVIVTLDEVLRNQADRKLLLDWNLFKLMLYHVLNGEVVGNDKNRSI